MGELQMDEKQFSQEYAETSYTFKSPTDPIIASLIFDNLKGDSVLELGCGPTHNVLALLLPDFPNTTAIDILDENIDYLLQCKKNQVITTNQLEAIKFRCKLEGSIFDKSQAISDIKSMYDRIIEITKHDVRNLKREYVGKFDSALQIGCFGCLDNILEFHEAVKNVFKYLKNGGHFLMVNWLQENFQERPYGFNGKLSSVLTKEMYGDVLEKSGFSLIEIDETKEISDLAKKFGDTSMLWSVVQKCL